MAGDETERGKSATRDADGSRSHPTPTFRREDATIPGAPPDIWLFREPEPLSRDLSIEVPAVAFGMDASELQAVDTFSKPACRIAVGGAKGGAGTSVVAANIALYLASVGRRVVLVDADPSGANLHTLVGSPSPVRSAAGQSAVLREVETPIQGLNVMYGGLDQGLSGRRPSSRTSLEMTLATTRADYIVLDLGACTSRGAIDTFLSATLAVLVTLPEPTALESTYRFMRRAFLRYACRTTVDEERATLIRKARELGGSPPPLDLWRNLEDDGDPLSEVVRDRMESFHPCIVINQTRLRADLELGEQVRMAARRRLGIALDYLGHIEYDDTVWSCVRARRMLLIESPGTKASKNVEKIARRLLALQTGKRKPAVRTVPPESHHDLLEVERGATDEEVRRAFKASRDIYSADALACYSLFEKHELDVLRTRLEEAYDVLLDPIRRRPYELSVFPPSAQDDEPPPDESREHELLPPPPELTPDTDYTGALLRAVRESRGISLRDISGRTKVGLVYLEAIESDDFAVLPAHVYVRGFVTEIAKALKLDAPQVSRTYVRRLKRYLEERGKGL